MQMQTASTVSLERVQQFRLPSWFTRHNTPKALVNSAEQLSKCFFSALFPEAFPLFDAKVNTVSWKEFLRGFFFFSTPLDTLGSSLQMDTCCADSSWKHHRLHLGRHTAQAGGFTESSNSKGCWCQLLARWDKADNSLYMGLSLPKPCHYFLISSFVCVLSFLSDTVCHFYVCLYNALKQSNAFHEDFNK